VLTVESASGGNKHPEIVSSPHCAKIQASLPSELRGPALFGVLFGSALPKLVLAVEASG